MKGGIKILGLLLLIAVLAAGSITLAFPDNERVRAKIGIQINSGGRCTRAKSSDRLRAGDRLRIYVSPKTISYVYVVYTDQKTATLLNSGKERNRVSRLTLPSPGGYYQVDGESPWEAFTIICSPKEVTDALALLFSGQAPHARWAELEKKLLDRGKIDLTQKAEKPISIAGNVRGAGEPPDADPFLKELRMFSGMSVLVKKYELRVEK